MSEEFLPWENEVCIPLLVLTVFSLVSERAQIHRNLLQNSPQKHHLRPVHRVRSLLQLFFIATNGLSGIRYTFSHGAMAITLRLALITMNGF